MNEIKPKQCCPVCREMTYPVDCQRDPLDDLLDAAQREIEESWEFGVPVERKKDVDAQVQRLRDLADALDGKEIELDDVPPKNEG